MRALGGSEIKARRGTAKARVGRIKKKPMGLLRGEKLPNMSVMNGVTIVMISTTKSMKAPHQAPGIAITKAPTPLWPAGEFGEGRGAERTTCAEAGVPADIGGEAFAQHGE